MKRVDVKGCEVYEIPHTADRGDETRYVQRVSPTFARLVAIFDNFKDCWIYVAKN